MPEMAPNVTLVTRVRVTRDTQGTVMDGTRATVTYDTARSRGRAARCGHRCDRIPTEGPGRGTREVGQVADKKISPKAAEGSTAKTTSDDKAATRVTKKRVLRRASHKRSLKRAL
ncbi:MAG: hypothetical protein ACXVQT_01395 [Actinomycetota bacterium]